MDSLVSCPRSNIILTLSQYYPIHRLPPDSPSRDLLNLPLDPGFIPIKNIRFSLSLYAGFYPSPLRYSSSPSTSPTIILLCFYCRSRRRSRRPFTFSGRDSSSCKLGFGRLCLEHHHLFLLFISRLVLHRPRRTNSHPHLPRSRYPYRYSQLSLSNHIPSHHSLQHHRPNIQGLSPQPPRSICFCLECPNFLPSKLSPGT